MTDFPRLLVATEFPPNASGGGPAVVRQILKGWPAEKLSWWSCLPEASQRFGQKVQWHHVATMPAKSYPNKKFAGMRSLFLERFWTPWAAGHLRKTIEAVKPDVIWVIPHNWSILPLAKVFKREDLRHHVSMHDYVDVHENPRRFGVQRCARMATAADGLYAGANTRDAICRAMAEDLEARTGKPANGIIRYGIEKAEFNILSEAEPRNSSEEIRIAYAGSILVEKEFELFIEALRAIRTTDHFPIRLHFFGAHPFAGRPWFDQQWMVERGNLSETELHRELRLCHWGFSPMSLTNDNARYNQFSFPTKFIAYLSAGLPVITMGHPESSVIKMAGQYKVGPSLVTSELAAVKDILRNALAESAPRQIYSSEILRCVKAEFDAGQMRHLVWEYLNVKQR